MRGLVGKTEPVLLHGLTERGVKRAALPPKK